MRIAMIGTLILFTAAAQEEPPTPDAAPDTTSRLDEITVTGSHIRAVDLETQHPILVMDRVEIERTGLTSISDVVEEIVANGQTFNRNINNVGNGEQIADLRGLGFNETLVLLNGARFVTDIDGAVDLSAIPLALVERIEVLLDGASAIYGSDAIAGVINIVTRRDVDGGEFGAYYGRTSYDDGTRHAYDLSWGHKSDRWSVSGGIEYSHDDPIYAGDRTISAVPIFGLPPGATGSLVTPFSFLLPDSSDVQLRLKSGALGTSPDDFRPVDRLHDRYNFAPSNFLQTPQQRRAAFVQGRYELNPTLALSADFLFNQRRSSVQLAPSVIRVDANNVGDPNAIPIAADNVYNPFGEPIDFATRRLVEAGPRVFQYEVNTTRLHVALDGLFTAFGRDFSWSTDASTTHANERRYDGPYLDNRKLALALGPSFRDAAGVARCGTPDAVVDGCVPLDLFGPPGSITAAMLDYASAFEVNRARDASDVLDAHVSTTRLFDLPDGPLAAAAGVEHRRESGALIIDPLDAGGFANGNGGTSDSTHGEYSVSEAYLELDATLLADRPFARKLDFVLGTRYSRYTNFGATTNSQLGLRWRPADDLLVRANYAQGFRAPAIFELFQGPARSRNVNLVDPCDPFNEPTAAILARCAALGVPADVDSTLEEGNVINQGNPHAQPETSRSRGVGVVYTPAWTTGLDASVDWYNIQLRNAIGNLGAQAVIDDCYARNDDQACALISRSSSTGAIFRVISVPRNLASGFETEGYDFALRYRRDTAIGRFTARLNANYTDYIGDLDQPAAGSPLPDGSTSFGNLVGLNTSDGGLFGVAWRWRAVAQLVWEQAPWSVSVTGRYFSAINEDCTQITRLAARLQDPSLRNLCSNPDQTLRFGYEFLPYNHVGSVTFTDVEASWSAPWNATVAVGVRNALDRAPPVAYTTFANSFFPDYDVPGRFWYVRYRQVF